MKSLIKIGRTGVIVLLIVSLATVAVPYDDALAGGLSGGATEATQMKNAANLKVTAIKDTLTAANTGITAGATTNLFVKENLLDGIAWAVAKQMVSNMTRSLINWINGGFQGAPSFVTDFKQLLLDSLDQVAGEYIKSLGGLGEFICSPFQLDVQAALDINYAQARSGMPSGPDQNLCTLTGIGANIENFLAGAADNWGQWFQVTANPQNTPYGAYLAAEASLNMRLRNEAGQEIEIARWGDGFLSKKVCQAVEGTTREDCIITTPGQVISEALTFQLSTGPRSLIEADEVNELIGALLNQLVLKAVEGLNGLLGLSQGGYDGGSGSYLDAVINEGAGLIDYTPYKKEMDEALARERSMLAVIRKILDLAPSRRASSTATSTASSSVTINLEDILTQTSSSSFTLNESTENRLPDTLSAEAVEDLVRDVNGVLNKVSSNLSALTVLIDRYDAASTTAAAELASSTATSTATSTRIAAQNARINEIRQEVILDYLALKSSGNLTTEAYLEEKRTRWQGIIYPYGGGEL